MIRLRKIRIFTLFRDQIRYSPTMFIINAVNIFQTRIGSFFDIVRNLDSRLPFAVFIDSTKLIHTSENRCFL